MREVHNWSARPYWPQGIERPKEVQPVPDGLDWDMWVGPAPERPYNKAYLPFVWRGWYDFGCGSFGDMGCYSFAGVFKILDLTPPTWVEASSSESFDETYPKASIVRLDTPRTTAAPPSTWPGTTATSSRRVPPDFPKADKPASTTTKASCTSATRA